MSDPHPPLAMAPSRARAWWLAVRPRTLAVAVGPVAVGTAVAHAGGALRVDAALAALAGALLLQVGSNFANDVYDSEKGADTEHRLGPPRAVQLGLLSPAEMKRGMAVVFALAAAVGLYLVAIAGWPVVAIGVASIATAWAYTGGPYPLGYHGLGDVAVFVFFGLVAVAGTEYVQSLRLSAEALAAAVPVGLLATAVLVVNNLRDVETDRVAGKRTLAVRLGARAARGEYAALVLAPYALLPCYAVAFGESLAVLLPVVTLPLAWPLVRGVLGGAVGAALNPVLGATARLGLAFSLAFALGYAL
ncbi:MAG: 1,4-dihydroxy-2-naphthoate polyprenyltransferase [Myxococcota bacterium]